MGFASWQRYCTASSSGRQPNFAASNRGRTYVRQGDHHVGHWPTFLVYHVADADSNSLCIPALPQQQPAWNFCVAIILDKQGQQSYYWWGLAFIDRSLLTGGRLQMLRERLFTRASINGRRILLTWLINCSRNLVLFRPDHYWTWLYGWYTCSMCSTVDIRPIIISWFDYCVLWNSC